MKSSWEVYSFMAERARKNEFLVCIIRICNLQIFCFESNHGYVEKTHLVCIPAEASVSCSQQRVLWRLLLSLFTNYLHQIQINNIMLLCIVWLHKPDRLFLWENKSFNSFQTEGCLWIRERLRLEVTSEGGLVQHLSL